MSFFWGHWYPCFGFLVTSPLGFKARVGSALFAIFAEANVMYIPQDSPLVLHLLTSWRPARSRSLPHMHVQRWDLAQIRTCNRTNRRRTRYHCASDPALNIKILSCYNLLKSEISWELVEFTSILLRMDFQETTSAFTLSQDNHRFHTVTLGIQYLNDQSFFKCLPFQESLHCLIWNVVSTLEEHWQKRFQYEFYEFHFLWLL